MEQLRDYLPTLQTEDALTTTEKTKMSERLSESVQRALQWIVRRLLDDYQPQQIILYGSLVYGELDHDSDIDLLIVKETTETPLERRVRVRRLVFDSERRVPFSPLVLTPDELNQRLTKGDPFYREILAEGKVLYVRN